MVSGKYRIMISPKRFNDFCWRLKATSSFVLFLTIFCVNQALLKWERSLWNGPYRDKYQRITAATWPAGPWPLINSPMIAAIKPNIATRPLRRSTKPRDPWFHGRFVVRPSPKASKGSYWKFWRDKGALSIRNWVYAEIQLRFIGLGHP